MPIVPVITTGWSSAAQPAAVHPAVAFRNNGGGYPRQWTEFGELLVQSVEDTPVIRIRPSQRRPGSLHFTACTAPVIRE